MVTGVTVADCETSCQQNVRCRAFHYRADTQDCGLKTSATPVATPTRWQQRYTHYTKQCPDGFAESKCVDLDDGCPLTKGKLCDDTAIQQSCRKTCGLC